MKLQQLFLRNSLIYLIASIAVGVIPFIFIPILTNILEPQELGKIGLLELCIAFSFPVISLGLHGALNVEFFNLKKEDFSSYVFSASILPIFMGGISIVALWSAFYFLEIEFALPLNWLVLILIIAINQFFYQTWLVITQCEKRPIAYGLMQFFMVLLNFGLSLVFITEFNLDADGRLYGLLVAYLIVGILSVIFLLRGGYLTLNLNLNYLLGALKYGVPLIPHLIGGMSIVYLDRYFIAEQLGAEKLGIYIVAVQMAFSLILIQNALNQAIIPFVFEKLGLRTIEADKIVSKLFFGYILFMGVTTILLCLSSQYIYEYFIDYKYQASQELVKYLAFSMFILSCSKIPINIILFEKKTYLLSFAAIISISCGWVVFDYFISKEGLRGAVIASMILSLVTLVIVSIFSFRIRKIKWI